MKILIAVIAFNEAENIKSTLQDLSDNNFGYDIVVIDDGSSDNTASLAADFGVAVIRHSINTGNAMETVKTYFTYAYRNHYDVVCQFDGDGQHIASELKKIIDPIKENAAEYIIGSRFLEKEGFQSSFFRRVAINSLSLICSKLMKQRITDITSGFRSYGRKTIHFFAREYKSEVHDTTQLLLLSYFAGIRIKEVPITMKARQFGESEFNPLRAISYVLKSFTNVLGTLLQRKNYKRTPAS